MSKKTLSFGLAIVGAVAIVASAGAATPFVSGAYAALGAAATVASGALAASAAKDAAKRAARLAEREASRGRAVEGTAVGGDNAHNLIFGRARVGGVLMNVGTLGSNNVTLVRFVAHGVTHAGGIEGVGSLYINGVAVPTTNAAMVTLNAGTATETRYIDSVPNGGDAVGMLSVRTYLGLHTQSIATGGIAAATDHGRGIAWSVFNLTRDLANDAAFQRAFSGGIPDVSIELLGLKCYDPRLDSTRGGSGTQRAENAQTWTYTDNPALQALTYALMRTLDGGCGRPLDQIDYAAFAAAATACQAQIDSPAVNKYRCNGVLSTEDDCDTNMDRLLAAMQGWWWEEAGLLRVLAGSYQTPSATVTDDWLAGGIEIENGNGLDALYNRVNVTYKSAASSYSAIEAYPFTNAAYQTEDGGRQLARDLAAPLCSHETNAQYLGQVEGRRSREQRRISLTTNLRGLALSVGNAVTLDLLAAPEVCGSNVYLITAKKFVMSEDGGLLLQFALQEHRQDTYTPTAFGVPSVANSYPDSYETPATPSSFSATPVADGVALQWLSPAATTYSAIEVEVASAVGGPYAAVATALKTDRYTHPTTNGALLFFRIRARNAQGQFSPYSAIINSAGKTVSDGADVSANNVLTLALNPGFEAGDKDWVKQTGWAIVNDPANARAGNWVAVFTGSTAAIINSRRIPVSDGSVITNAMWVKRTASATGYAQLRVDFLNAAGALLVQVVGPVVAGSTSYAQTRVVAIAPTGAVSAEISQAVFNRTAGSWYLDDLIVGHHTADPRQTPNVLVGGLGAVVSGATLSATNAGAINVSAFTVQIGSLAVSYAAVSNAVTGLTNSTAYYIYTDDPTFSGGTRSYFATTSVTTANAADGRIGLGRVTIPAAGGGNTEPPPDNNCVSSDATLADGRRVGDIQIGGRLAVIDDQGLGRMAIVSHAEPVLRPGVRLVTAVGALRCSCTTPVTLRDGRSVRATEMLGHSLRTVDSAREWWEPVIAVEPIPLLSVVHLTAEDSSYAAADAAAGPYFYTHNLASKP